MFPSSDYTLILVSIQRGLPPIFHKNSQRINEHRMLQLILIILGKTVKIIYKGVFKCISVVYKFSTMLLKKGCNTVDKVSFNPVEMWKTNVHIGRESTCGKLYRMVKRLDAFNAHFCSDVREHSNRISLQMSIPSFTFCKSNMFFHSITLSSPHTCGKVIQTVTALSDTNWCLWKTNKLEPQFRFNYC